MSKVLKLIVHKCMYKLRKYAHDCAHIEVYVESRCFLIVTRLHGSVCFLSTVLIASSRRSGEQASVSGADLEINIVFTISDNTNGNITYAVGRESPTEFQ